jgi:deoxyribose-phosphate aldolase
MIDHTLLAPEATADDVLHLCREAVEYGFIAVCVNPRFVRTAVKAIDEAAAGSAPDGRPVVATVAGFPLGASTIEVKATEAARALEDGAREIDMVIALGALVANDHAAVRQEIEALAHVVHQQPGALLKVILETGALTDEQIIQGCRCAAVGEADFVKTSTGFHKSGGATVEHVRLLHRHASPLRVKASGGIRTAESMAAMVDAGAARIGTSSGVAIMTAWNARNDG